MKVGIDAKRAYHNKSGLGNYSRDVINSLIKNSRLNIQLFTTEINNNFILPKNIKIHVPNYKILKNYWRSFCINKVLNSENIKIYHGLSNEIPFGLNKEIKCVVTIHDVIFKKFPAFYSRFEKFIYSKKTEYACKNAKKIICVSKQTKEDLISFFNVNPNKIEVVYQSCHKAFKSGLKKKNILSQYNLPNEYILNVGTIEKRKNLIFLLEAMKKNPEVNLVCVGKEKKYKKEIKSFILKNNLKNKILFPSVNDVNDLSDIYKKAKCLVYPSIYEGFGIPIIEGLYSEIPVITMNKPIFKEAGGNHCHYVNNTDELKNIINKIWSQKKIKNEEGRKWVYKFDSEKQANQIADIYQKL